MNSKDVEKAYRLCNLADGCMMILIVILVAVGAALVGGR